MRLRTARANGKTLNDGDSAWLGEYESAPRARSAPRLAPTAGPSPRVESAHAEREHATAPPPSRAEIPHGFVPIDFGRPQTPLNEQPESPVICPAGPNCPRCRAAKGADRCGTTGEPVWPPMEIEGAEGLAGTLLGIISLIARFIRKDKAFIIPTDTERTALAKAIQRSANRRMNVLGAVDDLFALAFVGGMAVKRALTAPGPAPELPPQSPSEDS